MNSGPDTDAARGEPGPALDEPSDELVVDVFARHCSSRAALEDVGSKWGILAMLALGEGSYRFNALRRRVEGVSEKMLSRTLQILERDGLLVREVISTIPARVEYSLTPLGERVAAQLRVLADLFEASAADISRARADFDTSRRA
ncbi:helix-turn-helix domain-containing protein [Frankia sp. AgB32]|uniref:winged helix-turn-helix transcriptional regulator n=1 Tax=Frankia sp. AgB32 TaxID=631119 RepID=UPI00200C97F9|nr:helix-turn-helix domain-containing protein [Frankia sp. AgB32]MCK9893228.1 helix-turn-helix transcriptional regulator [Frankia sp. AgB32]